MYRGVNEKREGKTGKKAAFSLGIFDLRGVNERGWLRRGVETGNGTGVLSANCANLRKFLTAEILNRKDLIERRERGFASRNGRNGRKGV